MASLLLHGNGDMLRITEQGPNTEGFATLVVEGRLAGPWVDELRNSAARNAFVALDLAGISYADDAGVALLNQLIATGAKIVRTTAYVATLLGRVR